MVTDLIFRAHALERMFERGVTVEEVRLVIDIGKTIEDYPEDWPYPSKLTIGSVAGRPLHVVAAEAEDSTIVITVHEPNPALWEADFEKRKTQ
jgi:Domain of unknown function (DUF4258)